MKKINKTSAIKIFDEILKTNQKKRKKFLKMGFAEWIIICAFCFLCITAGLLVGYYLYKFEFLKTLMLILLLVVQVLIYIVWPAYITFDAIKIIINPFKFLLENIKEEFCHIELELISKLKKHKISVLALTVRRLRFECRKRYNFSKLILGPLRTMGLIPALITTAFTVYQIYNNTPFGISANFITIINFISVAFVGLYFGNLSLASVISRLKLYIFLIERTIYLKKLAIKNSP